MEIEETTETTKRGPGRPKKVESVSAEAQSVRKPAPNVRVSRVRGDERENIVRMYAPECLHVQASRNIKGKEVAIGEYENEWSAYFGDPKVPAEHYRKLGYTAVLDANGEQVHHKGDPLFKRPMKEFLADMNESSEMSAEITRSFMDGENDEATAQGLSKVPDPR